MNNNSQNLIHASLESIKNQVKMLNYDENINELEIYFIAQRINILEKMLIKYTQNLNH